MPIEFTSHQQQALERQGHLAVTANAGAGKTRVLVERFVRVVGNGVPVSAVLALTYTEKAASELRRRIADRIAGEIALEGDPERVARFEEVRDGLNAAFIGTIHSFCRRILREFPVESGVDAEFTVLDRADAHRLIEESLGDAVRTVMHGDLPELPRERLLGVVRALGKTRFLRNVHAFIAAREKIDRLTRTGGVLSRTDEELLALWRKTFQDTIGVELTAPSLRKDLVRLVNAARSLPGTDPTLWMAALSPGIALQEQAAAFEQLCETLFTKDNRLRKKLFPDDARSEDLEIIANHVVEKRDRLGTLLKQIAAGNMDDLHRTLLESIRVLLTVARLADRLYASRKDEEGRLDFDDLEARLRDLLLNPAVRDQLSDRFRFVMIDEYQDTNNPQLEILLPILDNLHKGNLFIVGDPKQSIYRFRGADAGIFRSTQQMVAGISGSASGIALGESFRPLRDVAAFVNFVFSRVMRPDRNDMGGEAPHASQVNHILMPYESLIVARGNESAGRVELLLTRSSNEGALNQHEIVARRILQIVHRRETVYDLHEQPRSVSFRDIAVLLRDRRELEDLEHTFARNGIPYVVTGGIGYFQTQDVYDLYNYLCFLLNTNDDISLAGILRSPMFSVSDADLFRIARSRGERSLWEALSSSADLVGEGESLARARRILTEDIVLGVRLPVPELLESIMRRTLLRSVLPGSERGLQAMANLDKLLAMARGFEAQGFTALFDFVERLRGFIEEEEREGQATVETQNEALQIMTVHAAKGLEFPVVVIPHLQKTFRQDAEPFINMSLGIGLRRPDNPLSAHLANMSRRQVREEETRIFYVACTRARDILVLSADQNEREKGDSWLNLLSMAVDDAGGSLSDECLSIPVTTHRLRGGTTIPEQHTLIVQFVRSLDPEPFATDRRPQTAKVPFINFGHISSRSSGEIFSASKVRMYSECPSKYFLRYILGFQPLGQLFVHEEADELRDVEYPAELRGRVFHAVMEQIVGTDPERRAVESLVRSVIRRESVLETDDRDALITDVVSLVDAVVRSPQWSEISMGIEPLCEYSISAAFGNDFLTGTIDRLYRAPDGLWTILDYKTDTVTVGEASTRAEGYWPQLQFYAVMVARLKAVTRIRLRLVFAAQPDVRLEQLMDEAGLRRAEEGIRSIVLKIASGDFTPPRSPCRGCPFSPGGCFELRARTGPREVIS
jgi:ATP-dependent helicase/nuclease subunit A